RDSLDSLRDSILIGALLAVGVLLLFLRSWRSVLVVLLCLPLTVCVAFLGLKLFGQSLNLMTLGGLAVGLGLIIDDVVVTLENIYRHAEMGKPARQAALDGAAEILKPMVGSTLSTVAVFLPLMFLTEITGAFFAPLALTLTLLLLISVALAVTVVPAIAGRLLRGVRMAGEKEHAGPVHRLIGGLLDESLRTPWAAVGFAAALAVGAVFVYQGLPSGFMPDMDEGAIVLDYLGKPGWTLEDTDRQARQVEQEIRATPEVEAYSRRLGLEMGFFTTEPNRGDIMIKLKPRNQRRRSMREVMEDLEQRCSARLPGMTFEAIAPIADRVGDIAGEPSPIEVKLFGEDPKVLERLAGQAEEIVGSVKGTTESVHEIAVAGPELEVRIDPARAGAVGLTAQAVSDALRSGMEGAQDTVVTRGERLIGVRVLCPRPARRSLE
ncbi:MAG TPA: efflux RND transporter permease subunit, partial [Armatimonadota bacterium]|nr:efflux RND transporter permease subunit [Armatimonadota bacterium]